MPAGVQATELDGRGDANGARLKAWGPETRFVLGAASAHGSVASPSPNLGGCVGWSSVYLGLCRLFQLVVAAGQVGAFEGARDPFAAARAGDAAPAAAARTGSTCRSGNSCGARPGAAAERLGESVGTSGDALALAPRAGQAPLDIPASAAGTPAARSSGGGLLSGSGRSSSVTVCHLLRSGTRTRGETPSASTRRQHSPVISSPSRPPG
jgi:hypothetical protein